MISKHDLKDIYEILYVGEEKVRHTAEEHSRTRTQW